MWIGGFVLFLVFGFVLMLCKKYDFRVGFKKFMELVIFGELVCIDVCVQGIDMIYYCDLGGIQIVFKSLMVGDIDVYFDYMGMIVFEMLCLEEYDENVV